MNKIPVYLITGFLGSGKTTLLQNLIDNYFENQKLAIIQNEFAPHNFDGKELKRKSTREFNLLEVNNGSVFCVCLMANFVNSFSHFINEYQPDIVLFEASGLSDPIAMGEIFHSPQLENKIFLADIIAIVDATSFLKLEKLQMRMVHQVEVAHKILINKTDLQPNLGEVKEKIKKINPFAVIYETEFCNVSFDQLFQKHEIPQKASANSFQVSAEDLGRPDVKSVVIKTVTPIKESEAIHFLKTLANKMIRLKGYLLMNTGDGLSFQYSGQNLETIPLNRKIKQTEIIGMGYELLPRDVSKMYKIHC